MNESKLRSLEALVISALGVLAATYIGAKYLFPLALPFLIGWAVAFLSRPLSHKLATRLHLPEKPLRVFFALLFTVGALSALGFFLFRVFSQNGWNEKLFARGQFPLLNTLGRNSLLVYMLHQPVLYGLGLLYYYLLK